MKAILALVAALVLAFASPASALDKYVNGVLTPMTDAEVQALQAAQQAMQTPDVVYAQKIDDGLTITDPNGHCPACVGTWLIDAGAQADITATSASIQQDGVLPNGQTTMPWFDAKGLAHTFDIPSAKLFSTAVKEYVASLKLTKGALSIGAQATWPAPTKAIP